MARTCRRAGDFVRAREHLQEAERLHWPQGAIDLEHLLMQVQEFGARDRDEETLHHYVLSRQHQDEKLILEALVKGYLHTFYLAAALEWLDFWIKNYPDDYQPFLWRAQTHAKLRRRDQAIADYRRVLELSPNQLEAHRGLAGLLQTTGQDYTAAAEHYQKYLDVHPNDPTALLGLARCQRGRQDLDGARQTLGRLPAMHPELDRAYLLAGIIEADQENYDKALEYLRRAEALSPNEPGIVFQLGLVLRQAGNHQQAELYERKHEQLDRELKELYEITTTLVSDPRNVELRYKAGAILLRVGQEEGVRWLLTVLQEDSKHRPTHEALADFYDRAADPQAKRLAERHRRRAQELASEKSNP
jgi:tetratricopeptide (TPR) repeat protein